jgi:hypothetical protein
MSVHIYTTNAQPLTRWRIGTNILPKPSRWFTCSPRRQQRCENCLRLRYARNLVIRVYYDCSRVSCAEPCGCDENWEE